MRANQFFKSASIMITRHGQTTWNQQGIVQGRSPDPSIVLTDAGREAARASFAAMPKPDLIISSPLIRCQQTAEAGLGASFKNLPCRTRLCPDLMEIHAGHYEGRLLSDLKKDPFWQQWMQDPEAFPGFPEGENLSDFANRVLRGMSSICVEQGHTQQHICIITHGVAMRVIKCFIADQSLKNLWSFKVDNLEQISLSLEQILKFQAYYQNSQHDPLFDLRV